MDIVLVLDDLGTDETLLEVGVDDTGTLRRLPSLVERPGLHFHLARGDEGLQVEQGIGFLDESVHAALLQSQLVEEHLLVLVGLQAGDVLFCLGGYHQGFRSLGGGHFLHLPAVVITGLGRGLVHVADIEHGLGGEQEEVVGHLLLLLALEGDGAGVLALFQYVLVGLQHAHRYLGVLVVAHGGYLLLLGELSLDGFQVFQLQLGVYDLLVGQGIDGVSALAHHVVVVEAAQHVDDGIRLADVAQELIAQSLALGSAFHQSRYVHYLAGGGHDAARVHQLGQLVEPLVGHGDHAQVGFYRTEREVGCLRLRAGEAVEQRGLAHVGESHYTTF